MTNQESSSSKVRYIQQISDKSLPSIYIEKYCKVIPYEWGFSNKMIDLTRHIDKVRKA